MKISKLGRSCWLLSCGNGGLGWLLLSIFQALNLDVFPPLHVCNVGFHFFSKPTQIQYDLSTVRTGWGYGRDTGLFWLPYLHGSNPCEYKWPYSTLMFTSAKGRGLNTLPRSKASSPCPLSEVTSDFLVRTTWFPDCGHSDCNNRLPAQQGRGVHKQVGKSSRRQPAQFNTPPTRGHHVAGQTAAYRPRPLQAWGCFHSHRGWHCLLPCWWKCRDQYLCLRFLRRHLLESRLLTSGCWDIYK